jgi:murein DD-endopeptidase MepM/ murein hydrolase activator NlpD
MRLSDIVANSNQRARRGARHAEAWTRRHPLGVAIGLLAIGLLAGMGLRQAIGVGQLAALQQRDAARELALARVRDGAQREVNALAARLGELQAETNRLNALGERLIRMAQLQDGEFDFERPLGVGGAGPVTDMPANELRRGMQALGGQLGSTGVQLSVLDSLLFQRQLDLRSVPSRAPVADSYITSGFGARADPFGGGREFHKGVDFEAHTGDPVLAVADGVVTFAGVRSGYGNVVEVDHGNGLVTRYAHNSRLVVQVGDLVRRGQQIARAGSTGRSTGAHVHFEVWKDGRVVNPRPYLQPRSPLHG